MVKMIFACGALAVVAVLIPGFSGFPVDGSSSNSSTSTTQRNSTWISLSDPVPERDVKDGISMFVQYNLGRCPAGSDPVNDLYTCLRKNEHLVHFFETAGVVIPNANSSEETTSSPAEPDQRGNIVTLLKKVSAHSQDLCMNVDEFLACMDPYLLSCYPKRVSQDKDTEASTSSYDDFGDWSHILGSFVDMFNTSLNDSDTTTNSWIEPESTSFQSWSTSEESATESVSTPNLWSPPASSTPNTWTSPLSTSQEPSTEPADESTGESTDSSLSRFIIEETDLMIAMPDNATDSFSNDTDDRNVTVFVIDTIKIKPWSEGMTTLPDFFGLTYLNHADDISQFLRRSLQILCESNAEPNDLTPPIVDFLQAVPCVADLLASPSSSPSYGRNACPKSEDDDETSNSPGACLGFEDSYVSCLANVASEKCSAAGADIFHSLVDQYVDIAGAQCRDDQSTSDGKGIFFPAFNVTDSYLDFSVNDTDADSTNQSVANGDWLYLTLTDLNSTAANQSTSSS